MTQLTAETLQVTDPNEAAITEWLRLFVEPGQITELRALNVKRRYGKPVTISGFYEHDRLDVLVRDALTLTNRGMDSKPAPGVYFVINPIRTELLARRANRCDAAEQGSLTTDQDILCRRWILIDVDPVRASSISSSDEEKSHAEDVALTAYQHLKDLGWPRPIVVDSGNGWHLYFRVDLPVDDGDLVKHVLHALAERFDTDRAKIDTSVFNPSRISKLPGTKSRKGDDIAARPHRWSRIFNTPDVVLPVSREQLEAVAAEHRNKQPSKAGPPKGQGLRLNAKTISTGKGKSVIDRARAYLLTMPSAVAGQNGHGATYNAACRLVKGFALSNDEALPLLLEWNERCSPPWTEAELRHKLESAQQSGEEVGSLLKESHTTTRTRTSTGNADADEVYEVDDPRRLALLFLDQFCTESGEWRFVRWNCEWFRWDSTCYTLIQPEGLKSSLVNMIQQEFETDAVERLKAYESIPEDKRKEGSKPPKARKVTGQLVNNVMDHLAALTQVNPDAKLPSWIRNEPAGFDPREIVVAQNGIVKLRTLCSGDSDYLIPPTPDYFSTNCLPFRFDEQAPEPAEWLRFLGDLWPDDPDSIACLQEWMGLLLVPDNRFEKMLLVVGPRRSGKGTITKVIRALIGEANVAGPTLAGLATNFGLWSLIGKQVAVIGDARLSAKTDTAIVTERLLSISGDDPITIDRKGIKPITTTVPARFVMMTNEIPRFTDASNALAGRFIILRMLNSFYGQEDHGLAERLMQELPSILIWAIAGWQRLVENGRFTIPSASQDIATQLEDAASPVGAFVREKCEVGASFSVDRKALFTEWEEWCNAENRAHPGNANSFGIMLRAAVAGIQDVRRKTMGIRTREYTGIRLKSYETYVDELS